jgi:hypothetical protein
MFSLKLGISWMEFALYMKYYTSLDIKSTWIGFLKLILKSFMIRFPGDFVLYVYRSVVVPPLCVDGLKLW